MAHMSHSPVPERPYVGGFTARDDMDARDQLAERFEQERPHLRAVAYRMLGAWSEADDAVQESWVRLDRTDAAKIEDLRGWLTAVVGRICLDRLRTRKTHPEAYAGTWLPEPVVTTESADPAHDVVQADAVGLALLVVLETLTPAERLAFVLHDVFAVSFEEIAVILDKSAVAVRQLASRARRRVQSAAPDPDADLRVQRSVVDAFLAAARAGDFDRLRSRGHRCSAPRRWRDSSSATVRGSPATPVPRSSTAAPAPSCARPASARSWSA